MLGRGPQLVGHGEHLERGVGVGPVGGEVLRGHLARGERGTALTAQVEHRRELALRHRALDALADVGELAPRAPGLGKLACQLGAARVALERLQAPVLVGPVGPRVQRQPRGLGPIAEGVDGLGLDGRSQQGVAGPIAVARADPVRGDLAAGGAGGLDRLGDRAVQRAPAHPGDVRVERLAGERVVEGARARVALARQAVLEQLGQALGTRQRPDEVEVESLARDGGGLRCPAAGLGQLRGADEHRIAHRVGDRDLASAVELDAPRPRPQGTAHCQGRGELLDEERGALRRVVDRSHERRRGGGLEGEREQLGDVAGLQRPKGELLEPAGPPQLVAQPADAVVARQAIGAIGADHEHGEVAERLRERCEQLERRLVGPVQVVEDHQHGLIGSEAIERVADRLDERRAVRARGRLSQLGQEHRQVRHQRRGRVQGSGPGAQAGAQRGDNGPVGRAARVAGCAAEHERVGLASDDLGDQAALADARVAADEDDAAGAVAGALHRGGQLRQLGVAPEESPTVRHGPSLGAVRPVGPKYGMRIRKYGNSTDAGRSGPP